MDNVVYGKNTGYQLSQDRPYNPYDLLQAEFSTILTRNKSLGQQTSINVMLSTLNTENPNDYGWNALGAIGGTVGGHSLQRIRLNNQYGDILFKPFVSNLGGEYMGDPNRYKEASEHIKYKVREMERVYEGK